MMRVWAILFWAMAAMVIAACGNDGGSGNLAGKKANWTSSQTQQILAGCTDAIKKTTAPQSAQVPTCTCWVDKLTTAYTPQEANDQKNLDREYQMLKDCAVSNGWPDASSQVFMPGDLSSIVRAIRAEAAFSRRPQADDPVPPGPLRVLDKFKDKNAPHGPPAVFPAPKRVTDMSAEAPLKEKADIDMKKSGLIDQGFAKDENVRRVLPLPGGGFAVIVESTAIASKSPRAARVLLFDALGKFQHELNVFETVVHDIQVSPAGLLLVHVGGLATPRTIKVFDLTERPPRLLVSRTENEARPVGFDADGKNVLVARRGNEIGKATAPSGKTYPVYGTRLDLHDGRDYVKVARPIQIDDKGVGPATKIADGKLVVPSQSKLHFLTFPPDAKKEVPVESIALKHSNGKDLEFEGNDPIVVLKDGILVRAVTRPKDGKDAAHTVLLKIDPDTKKILWQHEATGKDLLWEGMVLKNGDILVRAQDRRGPTDNGANSKERVRILDARTGELKSESDESPATGAPSWSFRGGVIVSTPARAYDGNTGRPIPSFARPAAPAAATRHDVIQLSGGDNVIRRASGVGILE